MEGIISKKSIKCYRERSCSYKSDVQIFFLPKFFGYHIFNDIISDWALMTTPEAKFHEGECTGVCLCECLCDNFISSFESSKNWITGLSAVSYTYSCLIVQTFVCMVYNCNLLSFSPSLICLNMLKSIICKISFGHFHSTVSFFHILTNKMMVFMQKLIKCDDGVWEDKTESEVYPVKYLWLNVLCNYLF